MGQIKDFFLEPIPGAERLFDMQKFPRLTGVWTKSHMDG